MIVVALSPMSSSGVADGGATPRMRTLTPVARGLCGSVHARASYEKHLSPGTDLVLNGGILNNLPSIFNRSDWHLGPRCNIDTRETADNLLLLLLFSFLF